MPPLRPRPAQLQFQSQFLRTPTRLPSRIPHHRFPFRTYSSTPSPPRPPQPPKKEPSRVATFYRTFSYPVLKAFLGALFTYQLAYYAWMKLEVLVEKYDKQNEIVGLREELKDAVLEQRARAKTEANKVVGSGEGKVEGGKESVKEGVTEGGKKGWWPW